MLPSATQFAAAEHDFDAVSREGVLSVLSGTFADDDSALAADTAKIEVFAGVSNLCPPRAISIGEYPWWLSLSIQCTKHAVFS